MVIVITGAIGSGKSYVAEKLQQRGIKVYDCDSAAKRLMNDNEKLKKRLTDLVGDNTYNNEGRLNKAVVSRFLLLSEENKQKINDVVHPFVAEDFKKSGYSWIESAIYFESGFDKRIKADKVVCVTAPLEVREKRIMTRDNISQKQALQWITAQMSQEEILKRSDIEIINDGSADVDKQIDDLIKK